MTASGENGNGGTFEVARLTAVGRGAVACVGVRGVGAWEAALERWRRSDGGAAAFEPWSASAAARPYFGLFRLNEIGGASEEIVLRRRTPTAFELCGHGGDLVASALVRFFVERGAALVSGDVWERAVEREEAFWDKMGKSGAWDETEKNGEVGKIGETEENGEIGGERWNRRVDELFFSGADALVVRTTTETTARIALAQRSAWRRFFGGLRASARRAARLDDDRERRSAALELAARLDEIAGKYALGRRLTEPFVVLLIGIPNAGKSSFLNAALGFERVVVSATSGTTRDLVGATTVLDGWTFRFLDAAGLRDAADPIERAGMRLTVKAAERADVALRILDATVGRAAQEAVFDRLFGDRAAAFADRTFDVLNKIDLPSDRIAADWRDSANEAVGEDWENGANANGGEKETVWAVSAKTGAGVDAAMKRLVAATVGDASRTVGPIPWSVEQVAFLRSVRDACACGEFDAAAKAFEI